MVYIDTINSTLRFAISLLLKGVKGHTLSKQLFNKQKITGLLIDLTL